MASEGKGKIWYGMHFYPGVAEYQEGPSAYRVFLNESTIRSMDPSFAGRPVFVHHVDEIETDVDELRKEADGWVVESFYNKADGKHWVKFITVSEKADRAIANGMRLSNCYLPKKFGPSGLWNGVSYQKSIEAGEYEHLAIVPNPRYEESVIMTPEEFKAYNENQDIELKKLANNKSKERKMRFSFFKRTKVENSTDLENMMVELPKSKKEVAIEALINAADKEEMEKDQPKVAEGHHLVDVAGKTMTVNELVDKHKAMCDELESYKAKEKEGEEKKEVKDAEDDQDLEHDKKAPVESKDDKKEAMLREEEDKEVKDAKKKNDLDQADRLRNAHKNPPIEEARVFISADGVEVGKSLYGSN